MYVLGKKKVAGVLTELAYDDQRQPFFVMGFGVNVNSVLADFPSELRETATSVRIAAADARNKDVEICRTSAVMYYTLSVGKDLPTTKGGGNGFNHPAV